MIRGYVSSDEDDYDDYDFGYSEPLIIERQEPPALPEIQLPENKEKLYTALKDSEKIELFFRRLDSGDVGALEELISAGVSVDCEDEQKWTALIKACGSGNVDVVRFLLEAGANPNKDRELLTPLITCCTYTYVEQELKLNCVRLLLEHGAEVNAKDKYHTTALMYATESGYGDIVTELLGVPGTDVNIQDKEGWTALFYAVKNNDLNLVKKLFSAGTNLNLRDRLDRNAIQLALDKDLMNVAKVLGYVEERCQKPKPVNNLQSSKQLLSTLPDLNGQGGFSSDAQMILHAFDQVKVSQVSFPDFLNATEADLYNIGVILKPDRKMILQKGIHAYHLHPWKNSSLPQITQGIPLSLEGTISITGTLAKHLTIANASLRYLDSRIALRQREGDLDVQKEMIICLINIYQSAERMKIILPKILEQIKQIQPGTSDDYIYPFKKEGRRGKFLELFLYTLGAAAVGAISSHLLFKL